MSKKLYVGNLPYEIKDEDLREHFVQTGNVESATVITDRATGRSKGFGFVEMSTEEEAQKAIEMLNGKELNSRALTINEARPKEERGNRFGGSRN